MKTSKPKQPKKQKRRKTAKKKYKVRNWKEYNESLVNRGKIFFWITEKAMQEWEEKNKTGKRGKPKKFSNTAIQTIVVLQQVFRLPLRQAEGFVCSILERIGKHLAVPDHTTVCRRTKFLSVVIRVRPLSNEPIHIVVDSTGTKVYGEGEWKVRKHGWCRHRSWKKLHIGIDEDTQEIIVGEVTDNNTTDSDTLEPLLNQLPEETTIKQVSADGAYDQRKCYSLLQKYQVETIAIPPQHNARIWQHGNSKAERLVRDQNLRRIRTVGRSQWKDEIGYHRRSLSETGMFRLKVAFGDRVAARTNERQRVQLLTRCYALNRMTTLGLPDSYAVN